ncbi:MAG: response regulator, partial [Acidobacteria bacterium]|nr:response regulator [Acidobacteriota bacterium]
MTPRITIVEDEAAIAEVLQYNLEEAGFEVEALERGDEALQAILRRVPDLVLLDLMLPGLNGFDVARALRRNSRTAELPIIMLTARDAEVDRIVGLELGADDYVTKPFSPREVVLRVKAVLRRGKGAQAGEDALEVGRIRLDAGAHRAWADGEELTLTAMEFRLLRLLMERSERVQTRAGLLQEVWGYTDDVESRTADTHVRRLRQKLGAAGEQIETVVGVGATMLVGMGLVALSMVVML